jgi:hypothetical protein
MNRNAYPIISEGIDKAASSGHNKIREAKYAIRWEKRTRGKFRR